MSSSWNVMLAPVWVFNRSLREEHNEANPSKSAGSTPVWVSRVKKNKSKACYSYNWATTFVLSRTYVRHTAGGKTIKSKLLQRWLNMLSRIREDVDQWQPMINKPAPGTTDTVALRPVIWSYFQTIKLNILCRIAKINLIQIDLNGSTHWIQGKEGCIFLMHSMEPVKFDTLVGMQMKPSNHVGPQLRHS